MTAPYDRVPIAIVGLGRIGLQHVEAADRTDAVEVVAVMDTAPGRAAEISGGRYEVFSDLPSLVAANVARAAIVATPTKTHHTVVSSLLRDGLHVLCEKPCGLAPSVPIELGGLARALDRYLMIGYWRRFVPELQALKASISADTLGVVQAMQCLTWDASPPTPEFRDPRSSGGLFVDVAVHDIDLVRWLTARDITRAVSYQSPITTSAAIEGDPESAAILMELDSGALALSSIGRRRPNGEIERVEVIGAKRGREITYVLPSNAASATETALRNQLEALAAGVRGDADRHSCTPEDAGYVLAIAEALRQNGRCGDV